jgi:hypothetical protein
VYTLITSTKIEVIPCSSPWLNESSRSVPPNQQPNSVRKFIGTIDRSVVSSTNKTDRHDIAEILLEVALRTIKKTKNIPYNFISGAQNKTGENTL